MRNAICSRIVTLLVCAGLAVQVFAQTDRRMGLSGPRTGDRRMALVIGNAAYAASPLRNAANDATDVAAALRSVGFEVVLGVNWGQRQMEDAIREFGEKLKAGGVGLFYFAGHGMQVGGRNYLIPVGARIETESDVAYEAVDAGRVLGKMEDAGNGFNIVVLDACRNNPFGRGFRDSQKGLAQVTAPTGSFIAYATAPGSVAADGEGRNGTFTAALLEAIGTRGLTVENVFKRVRERVARETSKRQVPWDSSSLVGEFYFTGQPAAAEPAKPAIAPAAAAVVVDPKAVELELWAAIKESRDAADYEDYLKRYPGGTYEAVARAKIKQLRAAVAPVRTDAGATRPAAEPVSAAVQGGARSFDLGNGASIDMVRVEGGTFTMGSLNGDSDEQPIHRVTISQAYYLGKYEVTQGQWAAVMGTNPSNFKGENLPVEQVSWDDVQEFLRVLNSKTGGGWRLPTEAEWEYACRAGTSGDYAGDLNSMAWYGENSGGTTHAVGTKRPNGWGIYDMHGNVWEWCSDWYGTYTRDDQTDPRGAASGSSRVYRGGGWCYPAASCRSAYRLRFDPSFRFDSLGFRLARTS